MRVIGMRRTAGAVEGIDQVFGATVCTHCWSKATTWCSWRRTPRKRHALDAQAIGHMRHGAVLINVARGNLLDEAALLEALHSGRLAGAALDVFRTEPLPAESAFRDLPNVLITPHSMSTAIGENELLVDLFCDNLRRYLTVSRSATWSTSTAATDLRPGHFPFVTRTGLRVTRAAAAAARAVDPCGSRRSLDDAASHPRVALAGDEHHHLGNVGGRTGATERRHVQISCIYGVRLDRPPATPCQ